MTEPKKLPPLRNLYVPTIGEVVCAHYGDELDTKQSAEVIRRCEMHDRLEAENKRLREAIAWALGINGEFRQRKAIEGHYYWRTELYERAGLDKSKYLGDRQ